MKISIRRGLAATTALALGVSLSVGAASAAYAVDTWTITGLSLDNPVVVDTDNTAGDDGGFLGITETLVLRDGDTSVYSYDLSTLADVAATDGDTSFTLASDIKTAKSYQIETPNDNLIVQLEELDADGNVTATVITLSESIDVSSSEWFMISGFGWLGMWEWMDGILKIIDPTTGTVTTLTGVNQLTDFSPAPEENQGEGTGMFDAAGVGMFDGTDYWFVASDDNADISKFNITGTATSTVMLENAGGGGDTDNFMVSTCSNRFYMHDESPGSSWFGQDTSSMSEALLSADATFSESSEGACPNAPAPTPEPELPNTGVDAGAGFALFALLAGFGIVALTMARRLVAATK